MEDPGRGHAFRYGITFFWLSGGVQMRTELTDHVSRKQGRGWFRRVRLPPPPLVLGLFRRPPFFFLLALSGFARGGLGVLVLVFLLVPPLFFCFPRLVFRLRNFSFHCHFHLVFILFSHFHVMVRALVESPAAAGRVCESKQM